MRRDRPWTPDEDRVIKECNIAKMSAIATQRAVNALPCNAFVKRGWYALASRERSLGMDREPENISAKYGDLRFKKALIAAVKAGHERVFFGVIKDHSPIPPSAKRYDHGMPLGLTQSIAGECADNGSGG